MANREKMETVTEFISLGSKITADGDCSQEVKRHLLLARKAMTYINNILKSRDITLLTKVHVVNTTVFPVVMYRCDSWMINNAEHQRIDVFELWCWRRLLIKSVNSKRNQPWSYTERTNGDSTHWKRPWFWERLRVGGEGGKRGWDGWMASLTQWTGVWTNSGRQWRTRKCGILQSMGLQRVRLSDWKTTK